jgi:hypothetical protein
LFSVLTVVVELGGTDSGFGAAVAVTRGYITDGTRTVGETASRGGEAESVSRSGRSLWRARLHAMRKGTDLRQSKDEIGMCRT